MYKINYINISGEDMAYNRIAAVNYAYKYALKPNKEFVYFSLRENIGGDCTNFTSQCLLSGGASMTYSPQSWYYKKLLTPPKYECSISWSVAHSLYWLLRVNDEKGYQGPKGKQITNKNLLELGDIIFLRDSKGLVFHSAIITSFTSNREPLIAQHTFDALNIAIKDTWPRTAIHYIKIYL